MKQIKFLMVAFALVVGVALTSCNKDEDPGPQSWAGIVRVNTDGSFIDGSGQRLVPVNVKYITANIAYIYCQINEGQDLVNSKTINITLLADPQGIDGQTYTVPESTPATQYSNASIFTMNITDRYARYTPTYFDSEMLILPLSFFVKSGTTSATMAEELGKHQFSLVCYMDSIDPTDKELKLYLRHLVSDPETMRNSTTTWMFKAYSIYDMLQRFRAKTGLKNPTKIKVYTEENTNSDKLGSGSSVEKIYEMPYSF